MTAPVAHPATPTSLRTRLLATALVPSVVFVAAVLGVGWFLSDDASRVRSDAELVVRGVDVAEDLFTAVLDERRALALGGDVSAARARADLAAGEVAALAGATPHAPELRRTVGQLVAAAGELPQVRLRIAEGADPAAVYESFEPVVEPLVTVLQGNGVGGDADVAAAFGTASVAVAAGLGTADATVLAGASAGQVLEPSVYPEYVLHAAELEAFQDAVPALVEPVRARALELVASPGWSRLSRDVERLVAAGPAAPPDPSLADDPPDADGEPARGARAVPVDYAVAGDEVSAALLDIGFDQAREAAAQQSDRAAGRLTTLALVALGCVAGALLAAVVAVRTTTRLTRRLADLRADTLVGASRLPAVLDRLRRGDEVDVRAEIPDLDHGTDEIGQIAEAITHSRQAAIDAAAEEARTRAGADAVFLNIARRSQAIVHRQLQVLDEAERVEHNSDQLARLFQLDHLTTRERRNAENLIIMGGHEPRRQWRRPVPMSDVVRSAVSESEQYTRITLGDVPDALVDGAAVGDLIHLVAELVDNATSFSPPHSPIAVEATAVGRGIAIEVVDRGLGIEPEPRARLNAMLADPPDYSLMTLSEDSRLGMFVVARLAHRHGVRVTLTESPYGGVQVVVLVPHSALSDPDAPGVVPAGGEDDPEAPRGARTRGIPTVAAQADAGDAVDPPAPPTEAPGPVSPDAGAAAVVEPPELPERRPQSHLARELHEAPGDVEAGAGQEPPANRSSAAMSGLQRGSRAARAALEEPHRNGDQP